MDTKICRICGKFGINFSDIFKTEGLKYKIETCLPIFVTQFSLLPDTICPECLENVQNFYDFIKNCLQSIIILESQYNVTESCLKSKRKHDKGCTVNYGKSTKNTQTEDEYDILFTKYKSENTEKLLNNCDLINLVDYDVESELSENENAQNQGNVILVKTEKTHFENDENFHLKKRYFTNFENNWIDEIIERKRKNDSASIIENYPTKICKFENRRRKTKTPKKIQIPAEEEIIVENGEKNDSIIDLPPQFCLLCENVQFRDATELASHIFQVHQSDFNPVIESFMEKKRKIPNLVKISDIKRDSLDDQEFDFTCQICDFSSSSKQELYIHCRMKHPSELPLMCGVCFRPNATLFDLKEHLGSCIENFPTTTRYSCSVCKYGDDSMKGMENHVLIHDFLLDMCKKEVRMFDPADYVEVNNSYESGAVSPTSKSLICNLCNETDFNSFKDYSEHRRKMHSKFHCDLCSKFYGRNSHLWKHVNRLHKNHPSVTCQICYKTSASKYHLKQHFTKIHHLGGGFTKKKTSGSSDSELNETPTSNIIKTNVDGEFKCSKCMKGFTKKILLKKHKKNCRPKMQKDLLTRCKTCSRIFKDRQSLTKHLVNYHSEYSCEICHEKCQSKCEIITHIRFKHPNSHLICHICKQILRCKSNFNEHLNDHQNSYICQFCGDSLVSKIKLKMHILSLHRKILNLSCGVCLKLFENQHLLKNHVQISHKHELKNLTSCNVCGKNYGSKWKTYDHINKSHGRIFKVCKVCLEIFDNDQQLSMHSSEKHENRVKNDDDSYDDKEIFDNFMSELKNGKKEDSSTSNTTKRTVYVESDVPSLCEICKKTWPAKKHLWQHYIRCHKSDAATICGICLKTNEDYKSLQLHLKLNHPTLLHGQGFGSNFICRICGRYHNASSKLKLHMAIHENFDWTILNNENMKKEEYYESLIEEIEGSNSDDESNILEESSSTTTSSTSSNGNKEQRNNSSEDSENDDNDNTDDDENSNELTNGCYFDLESLKTEELDSAVKSISLENDDKNEEERQEFIGEIDYCEFSINSTLNESEIESAVGSIL